MIKKMIHFLFKNKRNDNYEVIKSKKVSTTADLLLTNPLNSSTKLQISAT
jgi:hypothetical protein